MPFSSASCVALRWLHGPPERTMGHAGDTSCTHPQHGGVDRLWPGRHHILFAEGSWCGRRARTPAGRCSIKDGFDKCQYQLLPPDLPVGRLQ